MFFNATKTSAELVQLSNELKAKDETIRLQEKAIKELKSEVKKLQETQKGTIIHQKCPQEVVISNVSAKIKNKSCKEPILSKPFYFLNGYRGILRIYMSSASDKNHDSISVYFGICKGPFDDDLEWPMLFGVVRIQLYVNGNCLKVRSYSCNQKSKDFIEAMKKPTDDSMSKFRGYTNFCYHNELPKQIENNEIKFIVDVTQHLKNNHIIKHYPSN